MARKLHSIGQPSGSLPIWQVRCCAESMFDNLVVESALRGHATKGAAHQVRCAHQVCSAHQRRGRALGKRVPRLEPEERVARINSASRIAHQPPWTCTPLYPLVKSSDHIAAPPSAGSSYETTWRRFQRTMR